MMNTTRSILGRLSSFSMGRGRLLASLLIETITMVIVNVNMITDMIIISGGKSVWPSYGMDEIFPCFQLVHVIRRLPTTG